MTEPEKVEEKMRKYPMFNLLCSSAIPGNICPMLVTALFVSFVLWMITFVIIALK